MPEPAFPSEKHPSALEKNPPPATDDVAETPRSSPRQHVFLLSLLWLSWLVAITSETLFWCELFWLGKRKRYGTLGKLQWWVVRTLRKNGMRNVRILVLVLQG
jgi:hypothetical protein